MELGWLFQAQNHHRSHHIRFFLCGIKNKNNKRGQIFQSKPSESLKKYWLFKKYIYKIIFQINRAFYLLISYKKTFLF